MAPTSPTSNSSSSDDSSPTINNNNSSSLFLSINAKPEPKSPESDSPIEEHLPLKTNKSSPSSSLSRDDKATEKNPTNDPASSKTDNKHGNPVNKAVVSTATSTVNSSPQPQPPSNVVGTVSSTQPTNTSTAPLGSKPVLVQSKKAIHHQPMNAFLPPQLMHHPPQMFDPNASPYQPPIRIASGTTGKVYPVMPQGSVPNTLQYSYAFPASHQPTAFYPTPNSAVSVVHHDNSLYIPMMPASIPEAIENSEGSESEDGSVSEDDDQGYGIITMQKPSPYTEIKRKYEDLMKLYTKTCKELTAVNAELTDLKRKRADTGRGFLPPSGNISSSPVTKRKKIESPVLEPVKQNPFPGVQRNSYQQLETSITSLPPTMPLPPASSPLSDSSSTVSLNTLVYIYYYDGGCDGHGSRQLKANGKRIFIDINWDEIFKFRKDDCLHMCIFVNTSTVDKVKDSDLIATFKILRSDGDKVKISKIRENLRRLNLQNQFSHIGHIKFFIQIRGNDQIFDYTDKILLYSKTQHNIANFEPSNQKEYNELSKLFYQPERFTVFKKV